MALGSYSSNPGTAYHTDPLAAVVEKMLVKDHPHIQLSLYKQYSGKCPLSIVKDKIHWEPVFSVISRKDGWHIIKGSELLTEDDKAGFKIIEQPENHFVVVPDEKQDMIETCKAIMSHISNSLSS